MGMLIALHACDTATDDAIAKGKSTCKIVLCTPVTTNKFANNGANNALQYITKHGILMGSRLKWLQT
jgi:hypothetical protein